MILFFAAELVMHRERVERHCRGVTSSLNEFKTRFQQMVEEHDKEVRSTLNRQLANDIVTRRTLTSLDVLCRHQMNLAVTRHT